MNRVSISTGCLPRLEGRQFYELESVLRMMRRLMKESRADGFEFVLLPEWDSDGPPLTPSSAPLDCEKHAVDEVAEELRTRDFPILSVHANRDIGNYLCSGDTDEVNRGIRLIDECLSFTKAVGSQICVFHFWDTWKLSLNLPRLEAIYRRFQTAYPDVEASIENVPTRHEGKTPFQIMRGFKHKTLDLKWASMSNEFDAFSESFTGVDNVHVQGRLQAGRLVPTVGRLDFGNALATLKRKGYSGPFTVELEGATSYKDALNYVNRLKSHASWNSSF
jgi:sugar phosphate isomerase/epimerase